MDEVGHPVLGLERALCRSSRAPVDVGAGFICKPSHELGTWAQDVSVTG